MIQPTQELHCDIFHCWAVFFMLSMLICKGNFHTALYFSYALDFINILYLQRLLGYVCRLNPNFFHPTSVFQILEKLPWQGVEGDFPWDRGALFNRKC